MKTIVVYFSLEGNTKYVADKIVEYKSCDILRITPLKEYPKGNISKFIWGGKSVVFGEMPKLAPYKFHIDDYDIIIIGTPVWAGDFAPPIKTFIRENNFSQKKIALYACSGGGNAEKCFNNLKKELSNCNVIASLSLANPKEIQQTEKIKKFCDLM